MMRKKNRSKRNKTGNNTPLKERKRKDYPEKKN
jgi:hypothetical protein